MYCSVCSTWAVCISDKHYYNCSQRSNAARNISVSTEHLVLDIHLMVLLQGEGLRGSRSIVIVCIKHEYKILATASDQLEIILSTCR